MRETSGGFEKRNFGLTWIEISTIEQRWEKKGKRFSRSFPSSLHFFPLPSCCPRIPSTQFLIFHVCPIFVMTRIRHCFSSILLILVRLFQISNQPNSPNVTCLHWAPVLGSASFALRHVPAPIDRAQVFPNCPTFS